MVCFSKLRDNLERLDIDQKYLSFQIPFRICVKSKNIQFRCLLYSNACWVTHRCLGKVVFRLS